MYYFIVNPSASSGNGLIVWLQVEAHLKQRGVSYRHYLLSGPGEARRIAAGLCTKEENVTAIVVGGDGTINEFLSGLTRFDNITFAYIPTGSGNDFARGLRLPSDPAACVSMILRSEKYRRINIGTVNSDGKTGRFAVSSGMGFDAAVCHAAYRSRIKKALNRFHLGRLVYLINALGLLITIKPFRAKVLIDDNDLLIFDRILFAAAMNTPYEGGGFMFAPGADPSDGYIDLLIAEGIPKPMIPFMLPTALFGKHLGFSGVHLYHCKKAVIESTSEACVHMDGEHFGFHRKVTFSLMGETLRLITK